MKIFGEGRLAGREGSVHSLRSAELGLLDAMTIGFDLKPEQIDASQLQLIGRRESTFDGFRWLQHRKLLLLGWTLMSTSERRRSRD